MDKAHFSDLVEKAKLIKHKLTSALHLSNLYSGAFRDNPVARVKLLAKCLEQLDRLLATLNQANESVNEKYVVDATEILWEVIDAHEKMVDEAVRTSLQPIPDYIEKKLEQIKTQLAHSPIRVKPRDTENARVVLS